MKSKTKGVQSWHELVDFIENINPYKETIVLTGWINAPIGDKFKIVKLIFTTKPSKIVLLNEERTNKNGNNRSIKKTKRQEITAKN